jgi:D-serine deaminase-like pyridoxal phosphate-dependent protein
MAEAVTQEMSIDRLPTPCLLLDETAMDRNIARLRGRLNALGVTLRPHLKTAKSIEVARRVMPAMTGPATVSTLAEAEFFAAHGVKDIMYAVSIIPNKMDRVMALRAKGVDLAVILDDLDVAAAVASRAAAAGDKLPVLIELDCDGHRAGLAPGQLDRATALGQTLERNGATLRGVMTHAGDSYFCRSEEELRALAERERAMAVDYAAGLRQNGFACPVVSVGSTPTAHFARDLLGVTEVRAGVYMFFDLVMAGIGVCDVSDIALSVHTKVIGHRLDKGWIIVDAGWMAMSRDRGTSRQSVDQGYGIACNIEGRPFPDLIMIEANQEHGVLAMRPGSAATLPHLGIGTSIRILPNHACATGAQHTHYNVIDAERRVVDQWQRMRGW